MMMRRLVLSAGSLLLSLLPASALAQSEPKVGLSMGVPTAISLIWRVNDRIALRPEFGFSANSTTTTTTTTIPGISAPTSTATISGWTLAPAISALIGIAKWDAVRAYVTPRFVYSRVSLSSQGTTALPATSSAFGVAGAIGAEYTLHRRFGVYGEAGLAFSRQTSKMTIAGLSTGQSRSHDFGIRSAVGAILYF
jgi:hypothetical protein